MKLGTYIAQGVLVTKMELWIPPSSSYVSNVTARLRENRLYAGWTTLACPGGVWGSLYVLWMVYEVSKQVPSIKQHGRCIQACGGAITGDPQNHAETIRGTTEGLMPPLPITAVLW